MIRSTFTAELHCQYGQVGVIDTPLSAHPIFSADQDGWLCTEALRGETASFKPVIFEFTFIKETENRIHYTINCADTWDFAGARLEQNRNGWLGLYGTYVIGRVADALNPANLLPPLQDQWKIETLQEWDGDVESAESIEFYLRDKHGHRVAQVLARYTRNKPPLRYWFLHAGDMDGEILRFCLRNIKVS
ncbi:hypothetical protein [Pseudomonas fluorescens]|uniref:hypothetical protein n=1 Tax=Pseudomonas fluorescens TaxID=294 RepID=UPI0017829D5D|nr:hypothetical protein [Pseudomonas fluorescens]